MPEYDIALELARLHVLQGADFVRQLKALTLYNIFKAIQNERDIFAAEGCHREDFPMLLDAARKAVTHGNRVFILPNPKGIRTADFIFENRGVYKMTGRISFLMISSSSSSTCCRTPFGSFTPTSREFFAGRSDLRSSAR